MIYGYIGYNVMDIASHIDDTLTLSIFINLNSEKLPTINHTHKVKYQCNIVINGVPIWCT